MSPLEQAAMQINPPRPSPSSVLMIKAHSLGVGDLLRSSAAWRALKNRWPAVQLHLLFLSKHEGYPTAELISEHHLLTSAQFLTIQRGNPAEHRASRPKVSFLQLIRSVQEAAKRTQADWIIDFEPSGARTSLLTWFAARACGAQTLGINQVPGRGFFYTQSADSVQLYAKRRDLKLPLEYTHRDFVVLAAWGIERTTQHARNDPSEQSCPDQVGEQTLSIELQVSEQARLCQKNLMTALAMLEGCASPKEASRAEQSAGSNGALGEGRSTAFVSKKPLLIGLNIGCGTQDALYKRPDLTRLAQCMVAIRQHLAHKLVLTGAPNEVQVNKDFTALYTNLLSEKIQNEVHKNAGQSPNTSKAFADDLAAQMVASSVLDYAGKTKLSGLSGVIDACDIFISTDSGPYHMSVALRRPTLVWFTYPEHTSFHDVAWCERLIEPGVAEFVQAFLRLASLNFAQSLDQGELKQSLLLS